MSGEEDSGAQDRVQEDTREYPCVTLMDVATHPRWTSWREVIKTDKRGKTSLQKVPLDLYTGELGSSTDPKKWGTYEQANEYAQKLKSELEKNERTKNLHVEVGVILGDFFEVIIAGVDLDSCRNPETGEIAPWAVEIIKRFDTYTEVSPSGTGVKLFFTWYEKQDGAFVRQALPGEGKHKVKFTRGGKEGGHPEAIELHLSNSFYTYTGKRLPDSTDILRPIPRETLEWLLYEAGPALRLDGAAEDKASPKRGAGQRGGSRRRQRDESASGEAWHIACEVMMRPGTDEELWAEMIAALKANPITLDWMGRTQGPERQLERLFTRAKAKVEKVQDSGDLVTEGTVADAFVRDHGAGLRYCHGHQAWFLWDGTRWHRDDVKRAFQYAHNLAQRLAQGQEAKVAVACGRASFAGGVERIAQAKPALAVNADHWDADPWLLGTPDGTVDLRTGLLHPASPGHRITKQTSVAPASTAHCPLWLRFLREATAGDDALIEFLQRWFGYTLTGETREHALLFVHGDGGNGKSVAINTVFDILGDYAKQAAMEAFTAIKAGMSRGTNDIAELVGRRMVVATEVDKGRTWDEARINQLTGGDKVTARLLYANNIEFTPSFKLTISGNHKPALKSVNDAARRRFNIVPFNHKPANPDLRLREKLHAEWPGILRWMIEGCLKWRASGLQRPKVVADATENYFRDQNTLEDWLNEKCSVDRGNSAMTEASSALYRDWQAWAKAQGEDAGTNKSFSAQLEGEGFEKLRKKTGVVFQGLKLRDAGMNLGEAGR